MKVQLLFAPMLLPAGIYDIMVPGTLPTSALALSAFLISTLPFAGRAFGQDPIVRLLSPVLLVARLCRRVWA